MWCQTVSVLLPGGVSNTSTSGFTLEVKNGSLLVSIPWPNWIGNESFLFFLKRNMKKAHEPIWKMTQERSGVEVANVMEQRFEEDFVLKSHSIKQEVRRLKQLNNNKELFATAHVPLDIDVQKEIKDDDWSFVGDKDGVRMIFVDLMEAVTEENNDGGERVKCIALDESKDDETIYEYED